MIKLSIIIVNWNTAKLLRQCLDSIIGDWCLVLGDSKKNKKQKIKTNTQPLSPNTEIIVVDNGSTDDSVKEFENFKFKIENSLKIVNCKLKIIKNKDNFGFAKGNNLGIKQAKGDYIMLLNSDTIVKKGVIGKLLEFLGKNPNVAVSPMLFLPDGRPQNDYYMRFPNLSQIFFYHNPLLRPLLNKIDFLGRKIFQKAKSSPFEVDQLPGAALIASKSVWDKVGRLDEDYRFLFEDVDWCWRARNNAVKLMVIPQAKITHLGGASWKGKCRKNKFGFYYQFFASMLLFVRKNYPKKDWGLFKWAIIVNFLLTFKPSLAITFCLNNGEQKIFLD